jgi:formylglycine-generating enzyme required for sulfatase activity
MSLGWFAQRVSLGLIGLSVAAVGCQSATPEPTGVTNTTGASQSSPRNAQVAIRNRADGAQPGQPGVRWELPIDDLWPDLAEPASAVGGGDSDTAIVVGVEDYALVADIAGARHNALDWYDYLTRTRLIPIERVQLLINEDATREELLSAVERAADRVGSAGTLWFIFVGHGAPAPDGKDGLLVGFDAQHKALSLEARSVRQSEILKLLEGSEAAEIRVLLDACFSGRTSRGEALIEGLQPLVVRSNAASVDSRTALLTAARSDQYAGSLPGLGRPAFSYLALGGLRGWADDDRDGLISANEMLGYTNRVLETLVRDRRQSPTLVGPGAVRFGVSAGESAPDLAAIVKRLAVERRPASSFQPTALLPPLPESAAPPEFDPASVELDFRSLDVAALAEYDRVVKFDASDAPPRAKARSWATFGLTYRQFDEISREREAAWSEVDRTHQAKVERERKRRVAMARDWAKLEPLLHLDVVSNEDKQSWALAFVEAYGDVPAENPHVFALLQFGTNRVEKTVLVPAGEFYSGCNEELDSECASVERPGKTRRLDAFEIDVTEVMVMAFKECVEAGRCETPETGGACNWGQSGRDIHPINCVDWKQAKAFCEWRGMRLPTEWEWEKAARGTDGRKYPWGNASFTSGPPRGNIAGRDADVAYVSKGDDGYAQTSPVGSFPAGKSVYGALDMAGNVWEWTASKFSLDGPVLRGGSWDDDARSARASSRHWGVPGRGSGDVGFRCAR